MAPEIDLQAFAAAHADGAFVLDVREPDEYVAGHVRGAAPVPLAHLHRRLGVLPKGEPVYVICASGNRSRAAASLLRAAGFDAISVAGGTVGWMSRGRPVVRGPRADDSAA